MVAETITLDMLTPMSVSVKRERKIEVDGEVHELTPHRKAYMNSPIGRQQVMDEVPEPYRAAIFAVWGDTSMVEDSMKVEDSMMEEIPAEEDEEEPADEFTE